MLPQWLVHLLNQCTYTNHPFFSSPFSLFPPYLLTQSSSSVSWCKTVVSFVSEQASDVSPYTELTAHDLHANSLFPTYLNPLDSFFPSSLNVHLFVFSIVSSSHRPPMRTGRSVPLPLPLRAGSTIQAPRKMLHWKWCFVLESQLLENQHGSVEKKCFCLFPKQNSCLLRQSFWLVSFLRFAKTLIQCLCLNREILWF